MPSRWERGVPQDYGREPAVWESSQVKKKQRDANLELVLARPSSWKMWVSCTQTLRLLAQNRLHSAAESLSLRARESLFISWIRDRSLLLCASGDLHMRLRAGGTGFTNQH
jgi:hypothetical protein